MTVVPHIPALLPDGSPPAETRAFVSQQVQQEAGQYVTDAQAAQAAAEAARDAALAAAGYMIVGAGRPDITGTLDPDTAARVAAAPSGAVFRSIDGPQGAWEWQKRGSTWVVTQGDTGYRNASDLLYEGWLGTPYLRRANGTATVMFSATQPLEVDPEKTPSHPLLSIPNGFRPRWSASVGHLGMGYGSAATVNVYGQNALSTTSRPTSWVSGRLEWDVHPLDWPTTLPGTSA